MYRPRALAASIVLAASCPFVPVCACVLVPLIDESDSRVLIVGKIAGHTKEEFEGHTIFGVIIKPIFEFGAVARSGAGNDRLFPYAVGNDCSNQYFPPSVELEERFEQDRLVSVIAYAGTGEVPGDLALGREAGIEFISDGCTAEQVASRRVDDKNASPACGSDLFHAYKEVVTLTNADEQQAVEILSRLSQTEITIRFHDLVSKFVSVEGDRSALLNMRYSDAMKNGCGKEPVEDYTIDEGYADRQTKRSRQFEYCTLDRQEPASRGR